MLGEGQGLGVLLSHHRDDQLHLCYRVNVFGRELFLCARCSGIYPAMFLVLLAERLSGPWTWWVQWTLLFLAPLPALVEWGITVATARPERSNLTRTLTGMGLGAAIGMNLAVNTRHLAAPAVTAQFVYFLAVVWLVWMLSYIRRSKARRSMASVKRRRKQSLQEFVFENMQGKPDVSADSESQKGSGPPQSPQTR